MPMTLCYRMAAKRATMKYLEQTLGQGWWGSESYASYYEQLEGDNNPFNWIRVHTCRDNDITGEHSRLFPGDHAGILETSETLACYPEDVDMSKLDGKLWFTRTAVDATAEFGQAALNTTAEDVRIILFGEDKK